MVTLADALTVLYPAASPLVDYTVADDGTGPRIAAWHLPGLQPTAEQLAAVTPEHVAMVRAGAQMTAAGALLLSSEPVSRAVRASDSVGYELRNNVAEVLGVVIDHVDELAAMPRAGRAAAIAGWIAADRLAWEQDGGVWAEVPPTPAAVLATGTDRVQRDELLPLVGAAVASGV
ncbi:XkdW family protein [Limnoglobus roseus]|uniref:Bacteriophage SP-beta YorD domain-containing protein n=1 Tax=Limnoglobus roseus TaxID=2598579 RepID=A0A5C1AKG9_9BACT|nr:hypothetical protein [Limnoglobus roseus]QEL18516.1 hypothetical protein PX52LOC_05543 [Limnoglobus roseus]